MAIKIRRSSQINKIHFNRKNDATVYFSIVTCILLFHNNKWVHSYVDAWNWEKKTFRLLRGKTELTKSKKLNRIDSYFWTILLLVTHNDCWQINRLSFGISKFRSGATWVLTEIDAVTFTKLIIIIIHYAYVQLIASFRASFGVRSLCISEFGCPIAPSCTTRQAWQNERTDDRQTKAFWTGCNVNCTVFVDVCVRTNIYESRPNQKYGWIEFEKCSTKTNKMNK